jgi:hypothetical protein
MAVNPETTEEHTTKLEIQTNIPITEPNTEPETTRTSTTTTPQIMTTTTISPYLIIDFCPAAAKTIDCSASGQFVYFVDAFYGVSDQLPPVCEYK